jgi:hypothetical protein
MAYEKLTFEAFKTALANGKYKNAGGARRAVGKASFSSAEYVQAQKVINEAFNETPVKQDKKVAAKPAKKTTAKTPAKAAKSAEKVTAKPAKVAAKATTKAAAPAKKPGAKRGPKPKKQATTTLDAAVAAAVSADVNLDDTASVSTRVKIAERGIVHAATSLTALVAARQAGHSIDNSVVENVSSLMDDATGLFRRIVNSLDTTAVQVVRQTVATTAAVQEEPIVTNGMNNAEKLFRQSSPLA